MPTTFDVLAGYAWVIASIGFAGFALLAGGAIFAYWRHR